MAFLKPSKVGATLTDAVANKASALRLEEAFQADSARNFQEAAVQAQVERLDAAKKAEAVEQAHKLLLEAGVDL